MAGQASRRSDRSSSWASAASPITTLRSRARDASARNAPASCTDTSATTVRAKVSRARPRPERVGGLGIEPGTQALTVMVEVVYAIDQ